MPYTWHGVLSRHPVRAGVWCGTGYSKMIAPCARNTRATGRFGPIYGKYSVKPQRLPAKHEVVIRHELSMPSAWAASRMHAKRLASIVHGRNALKSEGALLPLSAQACK